MKEYEENSQTLSLELVYENVKELSHKQDERKNQIDNKVNMILTIQLVILGIIIGAIEKTDEIGNIPCICIKILILLILASSIIIALIVIVKCIRILQGKKYRTFNPNEMIKSKNKDYAELLNEYIEEYTQNCNDNANANEKQMKSYGVCNVLLIIDVFFVVGVYITINIML